METRLPTNSTLENGKSYLGDGLYARVEYGAIVVTSENGISVLNEINIEPFVLFALINYALQQGIIKNV